MGSDFINLSVNALKQVREFSVKSGDRCIIHGGDWSHLKDRIYTKVWNAISKELTIWEKEDIFSYWLMGNHDFDSDVSLEVFNAFPHVAVITQPKSIIIQNTKTIFLPYGSTRIDLEKLLNIIKTDSNEKVAVFLHDYFRGITNYYGNETAVSGWELSDMLGDIVFAGHSHRYQEVEKDRIYHVGSPYQVSFNEVGQHKYFLQFDGKTVKKHEFTFPKFQEIHIGNNYNAKHYKGSYVKLKYISGSITHKQIQDVKKELLEAGAIKVKAEAQTVKRNKLERMEIKKETTNEEFLSKYVKAVKTSLNKKTLIELGRELIGGIND